MHDRRQVRYATYLAVLTRNHGDVGVLEAVSVHIGDEAVVHAAVGLGSIGDLQCVDVLAVEPAGGGLLVALLNNDELVGAKVNDVGHLGEVGVGELLEPLEARRRCAPYPAVQVGGVALVHSGVLGSARQHRLLGMAGIRKKLVHGHRVVLGRTADHVLGDASVHAGVADAEVLEEEAAGT